MSEASEFIRSHAEDLRRRIDRSESIADNVARDSRLTLRLGARAATTLPDADHFRFTFNHFLIEPYLKDAGLLIDRCIQQRAEYQELQTKEFEICIQIGEMLELVAITVGEEGIYDLPAQAQSLEATADRGQAEKLAAAAVLIGEAANTSELNRIDYVNRAKSLAFGTVDAQFPNRRIDAHGRPDVIEILLRDLAHSASEGPVDLAMTSQIKQMNSQKLAQLGGESVSRARADASDLLVSYKRSQALFQKARNEVAENLAARRAFAADSRGGALNFRERMAPVKERFANDFVAAWVRLRAAAQGLALLYDYMLPLPEVDAEGNIDFDAVVTWCQRTNVWLASFNEKHQTFSRSIGLRQFLGEARFNAGLTQGEWRFRFEEQEFFGLEFVRLRGIAVQVHPNAVGRFGSWNVVLTPPLRSRIRRFGAMSPEFDQSHVGRLFIGRVNERGFAGSMEIASAIKLYNVSPLGEWVLRLEGTSTDEAPVASIAGIDLHLGVAAL